MQIYDFIGINKQSIIGINNPILTIEGTCTKKDVSFVIMEDGDEIKFKQYKTKDENGFGIKAPLSADSKYIKAYVVENGKRLLIFTSRMNIFNRIGLKVELMGETFTLKVKAFFVELGPGLSYIWKKHRLLVPFDLWKPYFKKFKIKVSEKYEDLVDEQNNNED